MPPLWAHARPTNVPKSAQGGCTGTLGAMCAWVQPPATCVPTIESGHATMAPHMSDGWRCWPWPCTMGGSHARTQCLKGGWAYPEAHSQPVCQPGGTPKSGHNATLGTRPPRPPPTPVGGLGAHTCALPMCLEGLGGGPLVPGQPCGAWCTAQPVGPMQVWPHLQKARLQHWWHWLACLCTQVVWHAQAWCPVWPMAGWCQWWAGVWGPWQGVVPASKVKVQAPPLCCQAQGPAARLWLWWACLCTCLPSRPWCIACCPLWPGCSPGCRQCCPKWGWGQSGTKFTFSHHTNMPIPLSQTGHHRAHGCPLQCLKGYAPLSYYMGANSCWCACGCCC